ncbi:hypothetical protein DEJ33_10400, partial [Curtobacterium sp. MCPF17_047]
MRPLISVTLAAWSDCDCLAACTSSQLGYVAAEAAPDGTRATRAPACYSPIYAAASGTVTFACNGGGYGNQVLLDH